MTAVMANGNWDPGSYNFFFGTGVLIIEYIDCFVCRRYRCVILTGPDMAVVCNGDFHQLESMS
jgi:hypothetical protein